MAFDIDNFDANGSGSKGGPAIHTYSSSDSWATIEASGYFNSISTLLSAGDLIYIVSSNAAAGGSKLIRVDAITSGVVTTTPGGSPVYVSGQIADISTAGQTWLVSPIAGLVTKVYGVLQGAITGADATLTVKDKDGNSMGTITVANASSAAGDVDSLTPAANNDVAAGDAIEIETDGGSTNVVIESIIIEITPG